MRFIVLIVMASVAVKVCLSFPSNIRDDVARHATHTNDLRSPLRLKVKQYSHAFVTQINHIIRNGLKRLPKTEPYKSSRKILRKFQLSNRRYIKDLENCIWNLTDLNDDFNEFLDYFQSSNATAHERTVLKLLMVDGLSELKPKVGRAAWKFVNGEMGSLDGFRDEEC